MKKILILINLLLLSLIIATPTLAITPPPSSSIFTTSIVDVGLNYEHISFTVDTGYGLTGLPINGFWNYADNVDDGLVDYYIWFIVQDANNPFKLYIADVEQTLSSPMYVVRFNYNANIAHSYLAIQAVDGNEVLFSTAYSNVNSTYEIKRPKMSNEDYLNQLQDVYNNGYSDGYSDGYDISYDLGYDLGYNEGLSTDFGFNDVLEWVFMPFNILEKELAFGITFGHIALITVVFGIMGFLFSLKKGKQ